MCTVKLAIEGSALDGMVQQCLEGVLTVYDIGEVVSVQQQYLKLLTFRKRFQDAVGVAVDGDDDSACVHLSIDLKVKRTDMFGFELLSKPLQLDNIVFAIELYRPVQLLALV